jgi:hypothetical protein
MFRLFKQKTKELPKFEYLESYPDKNLFFIRTMQWDWLNEKMIHLFDNKSPRVITMDEWPQQIYLDANGQKTISEYILWLANQFDQGQVPEDLDQEIILMIENLIKDGEIIKLIEEKTTLPYYLNAPKSEQDINKAYELMIKDGYIEKK